MKNNLIATLSVIALMSVNSANFAFAEDAKVPAAAEEHDHNHADGKAKEKSKDAGMMGSMNMEGMSGMMNSCMEMHKDGKMCAHQAMSKCEESMKKGECKKMMKKAKKAAKNK
jgi:hypothetical protein